MINYSTIQDSPEYFDKVIELIEENFSYEKNHSYKDDFAPLVNSTNWKNLHILTEGDNLVAHIGARIMKSTAGVSFLLLGGIAVHETYKSQGHFKELFNKVIDLYKDQVALYVLWSDLEGLYKKFNFHEAGVLLQTGEKDFNESEASNMGLTKLDLASIDFNKLSQLQACYQSTANLFVSNNRDAMDWGVVSTLTSSPLYVHETNGMIDFYLFSGKGMDLKGVIHEFAGINPINTKLWLDRLNDYKVWVPAKNPWKEIETDTSLYMGIFRIGNPELFSQLIHNWSEEQITIIDVDETNIAFAFSGEEFVKPHGEFLQLLMGPGRAEEFLSIQKELWVTGIDSV